MALWTEAELTVLVVIYMNNSFSIGDDARPENHFIAAAIDRKPSAVDRQWRNIKDIFSGSDLSNVGQKVKDAVYRYRDDPSSCEQLARYYCSKNGWQFDDLLCGTFDSAHSGNSTATGHGIDREIGSHKKRKSTAK